jgi:hypothetical protein
VIRVMAGLKEQTRTDFGNVSFKMGGICPCSHTPLSG